MPRSQIDSAVLGPGSITVKGPLVLGPDEVDIIPLTVHVVLVQEKNAYAHGHGTSGGRGGPPGPGLSTGWTVLAKTDGTIFDQSRPALATGIMVFVDPGAPDGVPLPHTFTWTELVDLT